MGRIPENLNFCVFAECQYLENGDCEIDQCIFNAKWRSWWEHRLVQGAFMRSNPPEGMKACNNIYFDPILEKYVMEREE